MAVHPIAVLLRVPQRRQVNASAYEGTSLLNVCVPEFFLAVNLLSHSCLTVLRVCMSVCFGSNFQGAPEVGTGGDSVGEEIHPGQWFIALEARARKNYQIHQRRQVHESFFQFCSLQLSVS